MLKSFKITILGFCNFNLTKIRVSFFLKFRFSFEFYFSKAFYNQNLRKCWNCERMNQGVSLVKKFDYSLQRPILGSGFERMTYTVKKLIFCYNGAFGFFSSNKYSKIMWYLLHVVNLKFNWSFISYRWLKSTLHLRNRLKSSEVNEM